MKRSRRPSSGLLRNTWQKIERGDAMDNGLVFDYFYGAEAEQFAFFRIPKLLIKDRRFSTLSNDAKLLYGLMLDRMSLSRKNNWFDKENRAYIIYKVENVMEDLCCANGKASKLLMKLEEIGLIERNKPGLGKPAVIYVKNFMSIFDRNEKVGEEPFIDVNDCYQQGYQQDDTDGLVVSEAASPVKSTDVRKSHARECENRTSGDAETARQEMRESHVRGCENRTSGDAEITRQDVRKPHTNNTDFNNTDLSDTDHSQTDPIKTPSAGEVDEWWDHIDFSRPIKVTVKDADEGDPADGMTLAYEKLIRDNLWYDHYMESPVLSKEGKRLFDVLMKRIVRMVTDTPESITVKERRIPGEAAKSVFLKLRGEHLIFCIENMENSTGSITNPGAYMDSLLYRSFTEYAEKDSIEAVQAVGAYKNNFWP